MERDADLDAPARLQSDPPRLSSLACTPSVDPAGLRRHRELGVRLWQGVGLQPSTPAATKLMKLIVNEGLSESMISVPDRCNSETPTGDPRAAHRASITSVALNQETDNPNSSGSLDGSRGVESHVATDSARRVHPFFTPFAEELRESGMRAAPLQDDPKKALHNFAVYNLKATPQFETKAANPDITESLGWTFESSNTLSQLEEQSGEMTGVGYAANKKDAEKWAAVDLLLVLARKGLLRRYSHSQDVTHGSKATTTMPIDGAEVAQELCFHHAVDRLQQISVPPRHEGVNEILPISQQPRSKDTMHNTRPTTSTLEHPDPAVLGNGPTLRTHPSLLQERLFSAENGHLMEMLAISVVLRCTHPIVTIVASCLEDELPSSLLKCQHNMASCPLQHSGIENDLAERFTCTLGLNSDHIAIVSIFEEWALHRRTRGATATARDSSADPQRCDLSQCLVCGGCVDDGRMLQLAHRRMALLKWMDASTGLELAHPTSHWNALAHNMELVRLGVAVAGYGAVLMRLESERAWTDLWRDLHSGEVHTPPPHRARGARFLTRTRCAGNTMLWSEASALALALAAPQCDVLTSGDGDGILCLLGIEGGVEILCMRVLGELVPHLRCHLTEKTEVVRNALVGGAGICDLDFSTDSIAEALYGLTQILVYDRVRELKENA